MALIQKAITYKSYKLTINEMQLSIKLCQIFPNEGCIFCCPQHRNGERNDQGNLIMKFHARATILTISQKFNTIRSLLSLKVNE